MGKSRTRNDRKPAPAGGLRPVEATKEEARALFGEMSDDTRHEIYELGKWRARARARMRDKVYR